MDAHPQEAIDQVHPSFQDLYTQGDYLNKQPTWHLEESPWKARAVLRMLQQHQLVPAKVCEVGCGAGEVIRLVQLGLPATCELYGYEISPQAFALCQARANEHLHFKLADLTQEQETCFDLLLVMDVFEHVEDYFSFLRALKSRAEYKIFQIPLDISVRTVLRDRLIDYRKAYGHIHYFTKELALQALRDVGYEVLDWFYTMEDAELPPLHHASALRRLRRQLGQTKRRLGHGIDALLLKLMPDTAERIFGRWRLLVLAR